MAGARLAWVILPVAAGPAVAEALDAASSPVRWVAAVLCWGAWVVGLVALLVPTTVSLTVIRVLAPVAPLVGAWTGWGAPALMVGAAVAAGALATGLVFTPDLGRVFVQGSAYGDERRFPLRIPGVLLLGPVEVAWAVLVAAVVAGPLLLAAEQWVAGGVVTAVGVPVAVVLGRRLHRLSRRFFVFVPAGVALHDHMALADTAMFRRSAVERLGPAPADSTATDATAAALGLALELRLTEPSPVTLAGTARQPGGRGVVTTAVLFTPTQPGAVLDEARRRGFRVG